jgi:predicted RNA-binding Zn-ribbon protein involved in translation (DUF1610 family)
MLTQEEIRDCIIEGLCPQCGHVEGWNTLGEGMYQCPDCENILIWEDDDE